MLMPSSSEISAFNVIDDNERKNTTHTTRSSSSSSSSSHALLPPNYDASCLLFAAGKNKYGALGTGLNDFTNRMVPTRMVLFERKPLIGGGFVKYKGFLNRILENQGGSDDDNDRNDGEETVSAATTQNIHQHIDSTTTTTTSSPSSSEEQEQQQEYFIPTMIKKVVCGAYHCVMLSEGGEVFVCGFNSFKGVLTHADKLEVFQPLKFEKKVKLMSSGWFHLMILTEDDELYGIGLNSSGQLAVGDLNKRDTFTKIEIPKDFKHSEEENINESSMMESINTSSEEINNQSDSSDDIIHVETPHCISIKKICCQEHHSALISETGSLFVAGKNNMGELGIGKGSSRPAVKTFTKVEASFVAKDISFGKDHAVVLSQDGFIYVSGSNETGQIGLGNIKHVKRFTKIHLKIGYKVTKIACGFMHTTAICNVGGNILTAGSNLNGECGLGDRQKRTRFTLLKTNLIPKQISCGASLSLLLTDQYAYSCGINTDGRLATGDTAHFSAAYKKIKTMTTDIINRIACGAFASYFYFSHRKAILDSLPILSFPIRHYSWNKLHESVEIFGFEPLLKQVLPKFYTNVICNTNFLTTMNTFQISIVQLIIDCVQGHYQNKKKELIHFLSRLDFIQKLQLLYCLNHSECDVFVENVKRFVFLFLIEQTQEKFRDVKKDDVEFMSFLSEIETLMEYFEEKSNETNALPMQRNVPSTTSLLHKLYQFFSKRQQVQYFQSHPIHEQFNHGYLFSKLYNDATSSSDVKVIIDSKQMNMVHLHKTILSSASPVLEKMLGEEFGFSHEKDMLNLYDFESDTSDKQTTDTEIILKEKAIRGLLQSCYGVLKKQKSNSDDYNDISLVICMLYHGNILQMDHVIRFCCQKLSSVLSVDNFLVVCKWLMQFGDESFFARTNDGGTRSHNNQENPMMDIFQLLTQFAEMNSDELALKYKNHPSEWDNIPCIQSLLFKKSVKPPENSSNSSQQTHSKKCSIQ